LDQQIDGRWLGSQCLNSGQGIALLIGGPGITYLPESFSRFGQAQFLGLQSPVWVLIVLAILAHYSMAHTRFFRQFTIWVAIRRRRIYLE
jgi:ribose/xylose/arabinose/galactoside ABC-type transport system permease subunit